ncbi:ImmA/IrrE family metallo-endopeptidase [Candidatus Weimeria sp. HCP3S3_B5]|uniref:ImmA/IrrE family metallo-endopeptidase n=1 Tax=Candidatus Weimeria sp. HCP3S3_B5 TaxID=3438871 RepID=UPI003F8C4001
MAEIDRLELNAKAQELRESLGEDEESPIDIFTMAAGIESLTTVFYPLGDHISGICIRENDVRVIAINSSMSYGRQRYTVAHEFYHLYYDGDAGFNVCSKSFQTKSIIEKCADQFASYFLAPYGALRRLTADIRNNGINISIDQVIRLEQYFGMSHQAMLWRLYSENIISKSEMNTLTKSVIRNAQRLGYDTRLYRPSTKGESRRTYGHYINQVERLADGGIISNGKREELLLDAFRDDLVFGDTGNEGGVLID